jgi:hypothetical protein
MMKRLMLSSTTLNAMLESRELQLKWGIFREASTLQMNLMTKT